MEKPRKVAIVGFWEVTRGLAPFDDPAFEIWGLNHLFPYIPRWDRWFDLHSIEWSQKHLAPPVWEEMEKFFRATHGKPVYLQQRHDWIPDSIAYPLEPALAVVGRRYLTSGIAYMLALALLEGFEEIHLYGADMREGEYATERPCVEWLLGIAQGAGVKVYVPLPSGVLAADHLYGYEEDASAWIEIRRALEERVAETTTKQHEMLAASQTWDGARQEALDMLRRVDVRRRGGKL